jgi:two-component system chemotaxis sensor kinase CheA
MARLARDVARHLGKDVEFVVSGTETELDKTVVDAMADPLVHLVRNAVDHGVDEPEARRRLGKSARARIELRAFQRAGSLCIELEDDGAGLDEEAILARARERGLLAPGTELDAAAIRMLVFQPGFSTARTVTEVSGRGIGLDVVQRTVQTLRGRIEVRSRVGHGTTFAITLPPTLAIIDGMLVRAGRQRYVLPTLSILHMLRLEPGQVHHVLGQGRVLSYGRELVPLHGLLERLDGAPPPADDEARHVLVVEHESTRIALRVDEILGQQQIVVKPLTSAFVARAGLAGGAVLPDGSVGLILDLGALVLEDALSTTGRTLQPAPR